MIKSCLTFFFFRHLKTFDFISCKNSQSIKNIPGSSEKWNSRAMACEFREKKKSNVEERIAHHALGYEFIGISYRQIHHQYCKMVTSRVTCFCSGKNSDRYC